MKDTTSTELEFRSKIPWAAFLFYCTIFIIVPKGVGSTFHFIACWNLNGFQSNGHFKKNVWKNTPKNNNF